MKGAIRVLLVGAAAQREQELLPEGRRLPRPGGWPG
jgi:hypothetical protein